VGRFLARLIAANDGWAKPFGESAQRVVAGLFHRITPIRDLLNGTWLGHPLHPALTDVPIGALVVVILLDLIGVPDAAFWALALALLALVAAAVTGLADYADADGMARTRATLHGALMVIGTIVTLASMVVRLSAPGYDGGTTAQALLVVGFLVIAAGAYVGGDLVFVMGNMVTRHAFRGAGTKWIRLDTGGIIDLDMLPEATPQKMKAGINDLVVVRLGGTIHALHAVCAHAGGPLAEGTVTPDGCIECPWHASRFRLTDGRLRHGPSVYDQPAYEVRAAETGGYEVRRAAL
jgi:nitrite reductase/ring-hydroxylating ferredoxin subunit/uncharacterized membrane protein